MAFIGTPLDTRNTFQSLQGKRFNGDGSTTAFTLDVAPSSTLDIEVFVGNVRQDPNSAYTLSGTTLTFTGAPPSGTNNIYVVHQAKSVGTIDVPSAGVKADNLNSAVLTGQTDIGGAIADADLFLVDDGAGGTLRKTAASRIKTYVGSLAGIDDQSSSNDDQLTITDTAVVINEDSDDVDFRVEGNGVASLFHINAGDDRVGIAGDPDLGGAGSLHIKKSDSSSSSVNQYSDNIVIEEQEFPGMSFLSENSGAAQISFGDQDDDDVGFISYDHPNNFMNFRVNANEHFRIASDGTLTATDTSIGSNSDSRVKKNITNFTYDLAKFKQFQPKTFDWKNPTQHNNADGNRGFVAQDIQAIDDYWVGEIEIKEGTLDYDLIPADENGVHKSLTSKLGKKDAMYISVINQLITRIEALEE